MNEFVDGTGRLFKNERERYASMFFIRENEKEIKRIGLEFVVDKHHGMARAAGPHGPGHLLF